MPRSIAIYGDSISTYEGRTPEGFAVYYTPQRAVACGLSGERDTWWALLADALGGNVVANGAYSGSMVEGAGFPAARSPERIAAARAEDGARLDDIVVFIGINDYGWGGPRNQAAGRVAAVPPRTDLSDIPAAEPGLVQPDEPAGFEAAYAEMLSGLRAEHPQTRIWCCALVPGRVAGSPWPTFAWSLRGVPLRAYNEAIARAAATAGGLFVDACALGLDYEAIDGTHPTALGMRQLAGLFLAGMAAAGSPEAAQALGLDSLQPRAQTDAPTSGTRPTPDVSADLATARAALLDDPRWGYARDDAAKAPDTHAGFESTVPAPPCAIPPATTPGVDGTPAAPSALIAPQGSPWASRDWCPGRPCVGCPWARGTGKAWFCVCTRPRDGDATDAAAPQVGRPKAQ